MIDKDFKWEVTFKNVPENKVKQVSLKAVDVECYEDNTLKYLDKWKELAEDEEKRL